jgi:hypothetical protein
MKTLATSLLVAASIAVVMTGCKPTEEAGATSEHPAGKPAAEHPAAKQALDHAADEHPTPPPAKKAGKPLDHPAH